jgi:hypothetical protein
MIPTQGTREVGHALAQVARYDFPARDEVYHLVVGSFMRTRRFELMERKRMDDGLSEAKFQGWMARKGGVWESFMDKLK